MFSNISFAIENKRNIRVVSIKPGVIATPLWGKSIDENSKYLKDCEGYEDEMNFVMKNAQKNETKGLSVQKVVSTIIKADNSKNPKYKNGNAIEWLMYYEGYSFPETMQILLAYSSEDDWRQYLHKSQTQTKDSAPDYEDTYVLDETAEYPFA